MRAKRHQIDRIVLAYAGDVETSAAIPWLSEQYGAEVVTVTMDLGQGRELDDLHDRALAIGAVRAHVFDLREEFAGSFILPALQAGALDDPLTAALSRPLLAKQLVAVARIEEATAIAHGWGADAPDRTQLETSIRALDPSIHVLAPARQWELSRPDLLEYARQRAIPVPLGDSRYTVDANLWGRSIACLDASDLWSDAPEDVFLRTKLAAEAPDAPAYVEIEFERGTPIKINGVPMSLAELIQSLETIVGAHGVGRIDIVGRDQSGAASRQILEAPAAVALHMAHRELQTFVIPRELDRLSAEMAAKYVDVVLDGTWFSGARDAMDAFVANVQQTVTGIVRLKLQKGACQIAGVQTPQSSLPHCPIAPLPH